MRVKAMIKKAAGVGGVVLLSLSLTACGSHTKNLMVGVKANDPKEQQVLQTSQIKNMADFSVRMFQEAVKDGKSTMISPVSILAAMSMAANGAEGATLEQMSQTLFGTQNTDASVRGLASFLNKMEEESNHVFSSANSIWIKNDKNQFTPKKEFLEKNTNLLNSEVYSSDFGSDTLGAINDWVTKNTNGMITKLLDRIDPESVFQIINAVAFEDEWESPYEKMDMEEGTFTTEENQEKEATYLYSIEDAYLQDETAVGVVKPYKHGYSFVAILPNEGVSLADYVADLSGEQLLQMIAGAEETQVRTKLLKFKKETTLELNDSLQEMGIMDAFDPVKAKFHKMGTLQEGALYINKVLHKTFIDVNENGTRASAVTAITLECGAVIPEDIKSVELTRPFFYAIIENETSLPVFMGTVTDV